MTTTLYRRLCYGDDVMMTTTLRCYVVMMVGTADMLWCYVVVMMTTVFKLRYVMVMAYTTLLSYDDCYY